MNPISTLKAEVKDELATQEVAAFDYIPSRITPPVAVIAAGQPFIENRDGTFAESLIRLDVTLVAGQATNEKSTAALEDLIFKAFVAIGGDNIESVSQPFQLEVNNAFYLAATMTVAVHREMKEVI